MRIDPRDLKKMYELMPDGELLAVNRGELTELAQLVYDQEVERRRLNAEEETDEAEESAEGEEQEPEEWEEAEEDAVEGETPEWLEDAACACSFTVYPGSPAAARAGHARATLRAARIPSQLTVTREEAADENTAAREVLNVMVPGALALHATSILDRDLFNEDFEADWRAHLDVLSDSDLAALDPKIFCAGFLDRVARMRKAYADELARRGLGQRAE